MDFRLLELMEGARNLLKTVNVKEGQDVLITYTPRPHHGKYTDNVVVQAIMLAIEEAKANPFLLQLRPYDTDSTDIYSMSEAPRILEQALYNSNVVINLGGVPYRMKATIKALYDYGVTLVDLAANTYDLMTSEWAKFPVELLFAISRKCLAMIKPGSTFHCTDPLGTDITGQVSPWDHCDIPPLKTEWGFQGTHIFWPGLTWGTHPTGKVEGIICARYTHTENMEEPIRITVEDHWITKVEGGGIIGKKIKKDMFSYKDGNYLAEIMWGLNPKAPISLPMARSRRAGTLHFGWGQSITLGGPTVSENYHEDVDILEPTLTIDGKLLIDNGKLTLLEDPEIIESAQKYGDPKKVLSMYNG